MKDEKRGNKTSNFILITCLPMMWNVSTGILAEQFYEHMEKENNVATSPLKSSFLKNLL